MLLSLARAGVAVYSPHTAFDNTRGGINDLLARRLGIVDAIGLRPGRSCGQMKVVVFVPEKDLQSVADAMFAAGAGHIGEYRECSFRLAGIGTFFGSDTANPTIGQKGRREEVNEWRLEVVCPANRTEQVVAAMRRAHSYEEPAFDLYPLQALPSRSGEGRVGLLASARPLAELATAVKVVLARVRCRRSASRGGWCSGWRSCAARAANCWTTPCAAGRRAADRRTALSRLSASARPRIGPDPSGTLRHRALRRRGAGRPVAYTVPPVARLGQPARD